MMRSHYLKGRLETQHDKGLQQHTIYVHFKRTHKHIFTLKDTHTLKKQSHGQ